VVQQGSNYSQVLLRGLWVAILGLVLGGALGALISQQMSPVYRSTVYLLVVPESDNAGTSTANDYAQAYSKLVADPAVTGDAVDESEVGVDPWDVRKFVSVQVAPNAPILQITASSTVPEYASTLANALGSGLSTFTEENAEDTGYQADVIAEAIPPEDPTLPNWTLNIAVGAAAGLLVGAIVVLLWDGLSQTWRARTDGRRSRQEEKEKQQRARQEENDKQQLEREMSELEKSAERYRELENDKQQLEREMTELEKSAKRYRELRSNGLQKLHR
jgi:capsular polysaccharide biosynthesis protein